MILNNIVNLKPTSEVPKIELFVLQKISMPARPINYQNSIARPILTRPYIRTGQKDEWLVHFSLFWFVFVCLVRAVQNFLARPLMQKNVFWPVLICDPLYSSILNSGLNNRDRWWRRPIFVSLIVGNNNLKMDKNKMYVTSAEFPKSETKKCNKKTINIKNCKNLTP